MPVIFQTYYEKQYKTPCCSCVAVSTCLIYLLAIILPFLFVYRTNGKYKRINASLMYFVVIGLWTEEGIYWEQPQIQLKQEFLLEILNADGSSYQYSSLKSINDLVMNPMS